MLWCCIPHRNCEARTKSKCKCSHDPRGCWLPLEVACLIPPTFSSLFQGCAMPSDANAGASVVADICVMVVWSPESVHMTCSFYEFTVLSKDIRRIYEIFIILWNLNKKAFKMESVFRGRVRMEQLKMICIEKLLFSFLKNTGCVSMLFIFVYYLWDVLILLRTVFSDFLNMFNNMGKTRFRKVISLFIVNLDLNSLVIKADFTSPNYTSV